MRGPRHSSFCLSFGLRDDGDDGDGKERWTRTKPAEAQLEEN